MPSIETVELIRADFSKLGSINAGDQLLNIPVFKLQWGSISNCPEELTYIGAETLRLGYQKDLRGVGYQWPLALNGCCMSNSLRPLQNPSRNWYLAIAGNLEYFIVTGLHTLGLLVKKAWRTWYNISHQSGTLKRAKLGIANCYFLYRKTKCSKTWL